MHYLVLHIEIFIQSTFDPELISEILYHDWYRKDPITCTCFITKSLVCSAWTICYFILWLFTIRCAMQYFAVGEWGFLKTFFSFNIALAMCKYERSNRMNDTCLCLYFCESTRPVSQNSLSIHYFIQKPAAVYQRNKTINVGPRSEI